MSIYGKRQRYDWRRRARRSLFRINGLLACIVLLVAGLAGHNVGQRGAAVPGRRDARCAWPLCIHAERRDLRMAGEADAGGECGVLLEVGAGGAAMTTPILPDRAIDLFNASWTKPAS